MFSDKELEARIAEANSMFVNGEERSNVPPDPNGTPAQTRTLGTNQDPAQWIPIDLYNNTSRKLADNAKKTFPKGSSSLVKAVTKAIIEGETPAIGLVRANKKAKSDIDALKNSGDKARAALLATQYMEENFLPAVEAVINYSSPDELLNSKESLAALDEMAIGAGSMKGYTAAYIRQAYGGQLGRKEGESSPYVVGEMRRIRSLADSDQIRTAVGMAQKLKRQIDNGEQIASDEDYALLGRIVAYAN